MSLKHKLITITTIIVLIMSLFSINVFALKCSNCESETYNELCGSCMYCSKCNAMHTEETCHTCHEIHDTIILKGISKTAYIMNNFLSNGSLFYSATDAGDMTTEKLLRFEVTNPSFSGIFSYARNIYDALSVLARLLCVIYGLLHIMDESTQNELTPEKLVKTLIKMGAGLLIISEGFTIITACLNMGTVVFKRLDGSIAGNSVGAATCNFDLLAEKGWVAALGEIISMAIIFYAMNGVKLLITMLAWVRVMEILIRIAFSPIAIADLPYNGSQSNGFIYIKKLLASILQASVIIAASAAYNSIVASVTSVAGAAMGRLMMLTLAFVVVIIVLRSQALANDIVGVS